MGAFFAEYGIALFWVAIIALAAVVEAETCDLVAIWFVPGAIIAMILAFCGVELWIQAVVFIAVSAVSLTLFFSVFKKRIPKKKAIPTNADALIGTKGIVEEKIDNLHGTGSVKLRGLVWSARSADEEVTIEAGSIVIVKEIVGVKLICQRAE